MPNSNRGPGSRRWEQPRSADADDLATLIALRRLRRRRNPRRHAALGVAVVLVALIAAGLAGAAFTGNALVFGSCDLNSLRPITLGENSFLYANDGSLLGVIPSGTNRQPLALAAISPWLPQATVAVEDRRFYEHGALDYQGIARALYSDITAGRIVQGGSTLTQELVRNLYIGSNERTFSRKLKEACLAVKLAQRLSKPQILAAYLNEVFYGRHAYGAQAGAETFFSKSASKLTLPEAALLAGLPQAPSTYDPLTHPDRALARRNDVLRAMLVAGDISADEYGHALGAPLGLRPGSLYISLRHPNFFGWAEQQLVALYGVRRVEAGGLQVQTTLDPQMQAQANAAIASVLKHKSDPAAALVAIDPRTGAVKAMLGYLPDGQKLQFNLATQGGRTAGSSFKPFTLTTAMLQGISLYSSFSGPPQLTVPDPRCDTNGQHWLVHNFADESSGTMNLIDATAHSVNTIFAQLVDLVGPANVAKTARTMGITSPLQAVCSITLGSQAVSPLEMTDGYATLAARGIHHDPQAFAEVHGPTGALIAKSTPGTRAIPAQVADLVTYALERVVQYGTGTAAGLGRPVAGKTGTAENFQDAWFCGYVPQLATCVWVGYPKAEIPLLNVEGVGQVAGGTLPAEIWHNFMSVAVASLPVQGFVTPQITGHTAVPPFYAPSAAPVPQAPGVYSIPAGSGPAPTGENARH
ncbi:MAG: transglycosylase domain-containing protein [Gaiellaceae bacterium]